MDLRKFIHSIHVSWRQTCIESKVVLSTHVCLWSLWHTLVRSFAWYSWVFPPAKRAIIGYQLKIIAVRGTLKLREKLCCPHANKSRHQRDPNQQSIMSKLVELKLIKVIKLLSGVGEREKKSFKVLWLTSNDWAEKPFAIVRSNKAVNSLGRSWIYCKTFFTFLKQQRMKPSFWVELSINWRLMALNS